MLFLGYCPAFAEIGRKYGPIDLSFIPIGAYRPRWMLRPQHVDPEEAVQIHLDVRSVRSIGIHWGTFQLGHEVNLRALNILLYFCLFYFICILI